MISNASRYRERVQGGEFKGRNAGRIERGSGFAFFPFATFAVRTLGFVLFAVFAITTFFGFFRLATFAIGTFGVVLLTVFAITALFGFFRLTAFAIAVSSALFLSFGLAFSTVTASIRGFVSFGGVSGFGHGCNDCFGFDLGFVVLDNSEFLFKRDTGSFDAFDFFQQCSDTKSTTTTAHPADLDFESVENGFFRCCHQRRREQKTNGEKDCNEGQTFVETHGISSLF